MNRAITLTINGSARTAQVEPRRLMTVILRLAREKALERAK